MARHPATSPRSFSNHICSNYESIPGHIILCEGTNNGKITCLRETVFLWGPENLATLGDGETCGQYLEVCSRNNVLAERKVDPDAGLLDLHSHQTMLNWNGSLSKGLGGNDSHWGFWLRAQKSKVKEGPKRGLQVSARVTCYTLR